MVPLEDECEANDGLTPASAARAKRAVLDAGFNAINHAPEDGGQGLDTFQQMLIEEQWGRATGALWDVPWRPAIPLARGTEAQKERYLRPAVRGERREAYAITEERAGSDPSMVQTTARRDGDAWVLDGEKWHVTSGDVADFFLVHAHVDGDADKATVFLVDKDQPGVRLVRTPKYMHTFVFEHPIFAFEGVRVPADAVLGDVGQGYDLTKDWFVEERLMIGARTMGASARALELSLAFAEGREQFGRPIVGFQAIEFMLADMAAEIMAATSMLYRVCWMAAHGGIDRRQLHAQASAVKLDLQRDGGTRDRQGGPDPRGARLHAGAAGGTTVARGPGRPDLGGDVGDPAGRDRQRAPEAWPGSLHAVAGPGVSDATGDRGEHRKPPAAPTRWPVLRPGQTLTDFVRKARDREPFPAPNEVVRDPRPFPRQTRIRPAGRMGAVVLEPDPIG